jgi:MFS family permease
MTLSNPRSGTSAPPVLDDTRILFSTRIIRLFCYGSLSVVLALYLAQVGLDEKQIGLLFTLTLAGDAGITLWLTTSADRIGRKRTLVAGALLMIAAGLAFMLTRNPVILMAASIIGVISPTGNEIGPFLSIEQAALSQLLPDRERTRAFAWYSLVGSLATAAGALAGGWLTHFLVAAGWEALDAYHFILGVYALGGVLLGIAFLSLSSRVEAVMPPKISSTPRLLGLSSSRAVVLRLSSLFALDAFAGGLLVQAMMAYWFHIRFGVDAGVIGSIFFGANLLAGVSALLAVRLANRFGLINTMVFTHIPSNILLIVVPLMPSLPLAIAVLLLRFSISQMDVPTRQSYTMGVVAPDERAAAAGVTTIARSVGAAISPTLTGFFLSSPALLSLPFFLSGTIKILYDLLLYRSFVEHRPPEEQAHS